MKAHVVESSLTSITNMREDDDVFFKPIAASAANVKSHQFNSHLQEEYFGDTQALGSKQCRLDEFVMSVGARPMTT